jgi:hypothetical protein
VQTRQPRVAKTILWRIYLDEERKLHLPRQLRTIQRLLRELDDSLRPAPIRTKNRRNARLATGRDTNFRELRSRQQVSREKGPAQEPRARAPLAEILTTHLIRVDPKTVLSSMFARSFGLRVDG